MAAGVGTFDGHVTFLEPIFTKALLVLGFSIEQPIRQPAAYEAGGNYYPTTYAIGRDATIQEYVIALKNMVQR